MRFQAPYIVEIANGFFGEGGDRSKLTVNIF